MHPSTPLAHRQNPSASTDEIHPAAAFSAPGAARHLRPFRTTCGDPSQSAPDAFKYRTHSPTVVSVRASSNPPVRHSLPSSPRTTPSGTSIHRPTAFPRTPDAPPHPAATPAIANAAMTQNVLILAIQPSPPLPIKPSCPPIPSIPPIP